jgi:hypothetical protein
MVAMKHLLDTSVAGGSEDERAATLECFMRTLDVLTDDERDMLRNSGGVLTADQGDALEAAHPGLNAITAACLAPDMTLVSSAERNGQDAMPGRSAPSMDSGNASPVAPSAPPGGDEASTPPPPPPGNVTAPARGDVLDQAIADYVRQQGMMSAADGVARCMNGAFSQLAPDERPIMARALSGPSASDMQAMIAAHPDMMPSMQACVEALSRAAGG